MHKSIQVDVSELFGRSPIYKCNTSIVKIILPGIRRKTFSRGIVSQTIYNCIMFIEIVYPSGKSKGFTLRLIHVSSFTLERFENTKEDVVTRRTTINAMAKRKKTEEKHKQWTT